MLGKQLFCTNNDIINKLKQLAVKNSGHLVRENVSKNTVPMFFFPQQLQHHQFCQLEIEGSLDYGCAYPLNSYLISGVPSTFRSSSTAQLV